MNPFFTFRKIIKVLLQLPFYKEIIIKINIPYYSQWESPELIKQIVSKRIKAEDDPNWRRSGAKTKKEYALWSWNSCGMACFKMILAYRFRKIFPIVELGEKCKEYGGYKGKTLNGLYYHPFLIFIKKEFGLNGKIISPMTMYDIASEMRKDNIIIASVSHYIREKKKKGKPGGHLVLVTGINTKDKTLTLHNPSGINKATQQDFEISFDQFKNFFAFRGISVFA